MEQLYLQRVKILEEDIVRLSRFLGKIDYLGLDECNLTKGGISALADGINQRNKPVRLDCDLMTRANKNLRESVAKFDEKIAHCEG